MTKFADDLYDDLIDQHGAALTAVSPPATPRRHLASHRVALTAGAGGLAVAATAGSLVAVGGSPAYALTTNHDGSISLAVYQEPGIAQANAKLKSIGARVVVVPVRAGCPSIMSIRKPAVPLKGELRVRGAVNRTGSVTVDAQGVPRGDILVVGTETGPYRLTVAQLTSAPAPSCVSLPTPPTGGTGPSGASVHRAG
jgi:hypothetical protein